MSFPNLFSLHGKTALITGGAGFFGRYFVRGLLDSGSDRVIIVEKPDAGTKAVEILQEQYPDRVRLYEVDLYDGEGADTIFSLILDDVGCIDVLINNAFEFSPRTGFAPDHSGAFEVATHDQVRRCFESSVWWAFQATRKFGLAMRARGGGSIINITSPAGVRAIDPKQYQGFEHAPSPPGYGMAKAALIQQTRIAAMNLAPVRVNCLSPGAIPNLDESHERAGKG